MAEIPLASDPKLATEPLSIPAAQGVDGRPPLPATLILALQHVLTMYAGAVTVPLVVGSSLHLGPGATAYLVSSDLLACGIATLIQCLGLGPIGVRLPIMMGVTFVAVGPAIAIASNPALGLQGMFGASLAAGVFGLFIAPIFGRLSWLFSPVVTGTAMVLIGVSLMAVAANWIAAGAGGGPGGLLIALLVMACILLIVRFGKGFLANTAVLIGVALGFVAACLLGWVDLSPVAGADWLMLVSPFHFGWPRFDPLGIASMIIVMLITMVESSGMLFALSRIVERPLTTDALTRGLRADALGALVGGLFNSLPYTSYAQNVAIVGMTGVRSRYVCAAAGVILMVLATLPKLSFLVTSIPSPVLGGAALVMFGMVASNGIQTLGRVDFSAKTKNLYVIAVSLGVGLAPAAGPRLFDGLPPAVANFLHNGVMLGIVTAVLLNLALNSRSLDLHGDAPA